MRTALFILALLITALFINTNTFAGNSQDGAQKYKYEYLFNTDLPTSEFKEVFYNRLSEKHQWKQMGETNLQNDTFNSTWSFTDDNKQVWQCEVTISRNNSEEVAVTMEMNPLIGS